MNKGLILKLIELVLLVALTGFLALSIVRTLLLKEETITAVVTQHLCLQSSANKDEYKVMVQLQDGSAFYTDAMTSCLAIKQLVLGDEALITVRGELLMSVEQQGLRLLDSDELNKSAKETLYLLLLLIVISICLVVWSFRRNRKAVASNKEAINKEAINKETGNENK